MRTCRGTSDLPFDIPGQRFRVEEITLNLVSRPPDSLEPFSGDSCCWNLRPAVTIQDLQRRNRAHQLNRVVMVFRRNPFRSSAILDSRRFPKDLLENSSGGMDENGSPRPQDAQVRVIV